MHDTAIFIHGAPGRAAEWDAVTALAPPTTRCVAVSLPDTETEAPGTGVAELESCIAAGLDAARGTAITLVGHSLGAWLATRFATAPGVRRLVLIAGMDRFDAPALARISGMMEALTASPEAQPAVAEAVVASWFPATANEHPARAETLRFVHSIPAGRLVRIGARILEAAAQTPAPPWATPTTLLHDEADGAVPFAWGEALAARLPRAELVRTPGTGHMTQLLAPEFVARAAFAAR